MQTIIATSGSWVLAREGDRYFFCNLDTGKNIRTTKLLALAATVKWGYRRLKDGESDEWYFA